MLLSGRRYECAYYIGGYVVECALKACIAKRTKRSDFPAPPRTIQDVYTHDLAKLVRQAGLELELQEEINSDPHFAANWAVAKLWSEESRYDRKTALDAQDLYQAITDEAHGVLRWLERRW